MTFIWPRKEKSGIVHYYLRRTERGDDGKPKVVLNMYLGTADKILEKIRAGGGFLVNPDEFELMSFQFGTVAAIAAADADLGLTDIVSDVTGGSASTANALLSFMCGRSEEPLSKNAMQEWSKHSALKFLKALPSLSCRSYLRYMDKLAPEQVKSISFRIAEKLMQMGHNPSIVFFDTTNFSTEQQPPRDEDEREAEGRLLPRAGHAKDHNNQAKLVGLATATTAGPSYLPIIHETFQGNEADATLFQRTVSSMIETLTKLGVKCQDLCFVFDKGMNSENGFTALSGSGVHFVSALKKNQSKELLSEPLSDYGKKAYVTENGEEIETLRGKNTVTIMGVSGTVVVAYNASAARKQSEYYESAKKRFIDGCSEIAKSLAAAGEHRKGRPPTVEGVNRKVISLIPEKWRSLFRFHVGSTLDSDGKMTLTYWIDGKAERNRRKCFGKTVVFTDKSEWSDEKIVRTYFARSGMEEDYHVLKDALLLPVMPIYHRLDKRIRVHVFMCVLGLLFYRYIQWKIEKETGERLPMGRMVSLLHRIRLGGLILTDKEKQKGREWRKIRFKLERLENKQERAIVKALNLERFVPN